MKFKKNKARIRILSDIFSFPTLGDKWDGGLFAKQKPIVGDLVSLLSAPPSKFYLSWLREIVDDHGWPKYLLESIEDGSLCWWSNVSLFFYDRGKSQSVFWHWDDDQYAFDERWRRVFRKNRAYSLVHTIPQFNDKSVTLSIRVKWTTDTIASKDFENWKRLKSSEMNEFYLDTEREYESSNLRKQ